MALRSAAARAFLIPQGARTAAGTEGMMMNTNSSMGRRTPRYFSDGGKGRILSEEERAAENVYIQKMERERMEKMRRKAEKEKAEAEKKAKGGEKPEEHQIA